MEAILRNMEKNRKFFIIEMMTGMGQFTLLTGAFLAGFIHMLGGSDSLNGTIGAIPAIMGFMQIGSAMYLESLQERKRVTVKMITSLRTVLGLIYIIPILLIPFNLGLEVFIIMYVIGFGINALVAPAISDWLVNSTPAGIRGKYFAARERYAFIITILLSYSASKTLDYYKSIQQETTGFVLIGGTVLLLGLINIVFMRKMHEVNHEFQPSKYKFIEAVKMPLLDKKFRKVLILFVLWSAGFQMGAPFIAVYMISHLELSYTYVMAMTIVGTVMRIIFAPLWGKLADEKSWFLTAEGSVLLLGLAHLGWAFVSASNSQWLIPILSLLAGLAWGGVGLSLFNIQFIFAAIKGRTIFIAINAAISGVVSLLAVRTGGMIIDRYAMTQINIGLLSFNNIQAVIGMSALVLLMIPLYIHMIVRE